MSASNRKPSGDGVATAPNRPKPKAEIVARAQAEPESQGFAAIPHWINEHPKVKDADIRVLCVLLRYARNEPDCWPSLEAVGQAIGRTERSVRRSIENMKKFGIIAELADETKRTHRRLVLLWRVKEEEQDHPRGPSGRGERSCPRGTHTPDKSVRPGCVHPGQICPPSPDKSVQGGGTNLSGVPRTNLSAEEEALREKHCEKTTTTTERESLSSSSTNGFSNGEKTEDAITLDEVIAKAQAILSDEKPAKVEKFIRDLSAAYEPSWIPDALNIMEEKRGGLSLLRGILHNCKQEGVAPCFSKAKARPSPSSDPEFGALSDDERSEPSTLDKLNEMLPHDKRLILMSRPLAMRDGIEALFTQALDYGKLAGVDGPEPTLWELIQAALDPRYDPLDGMELKDKARKVRRELDSRRTTTGVTTA